MSNDKSGRKKIVKALVSIIIFLIATFFGVNITDILPNDETNNPTIQNPPNNEIQEAQGQLMLHMIDVGQADCFLLVQEDQTALVDCGTRSTGKDAVDYLKSIGIKKLDYVFGTHPHDDHMGGAAEVLNNIEVGKLYAPDIFDIMEYNKDGDPIKPPVWYSEMMTAVNSIDAQLNKGVPKNQQTSIWNFPVNEDGEFEKFTIGDAVVQFYAPLEDDYSDKNDYSICAKVSFGSIDIMMTGDATTAVEKALLKQNYDLDVEIFQAGHHGSDTSNSKDFLNEMSPECIVISCGMQNKHNHPLKSVIELFKNFGLPVYRTDESGNIIMTTDGTEYIFSAEPGTYTSGKEYNDQKGK